jgi:LysR family transcriptional regulator, hca operon transcriptional activator
MLKARVIGNVAARVDAERRLVHYRLSTLLYRESKVELRHVRYFVAVAETLNLRKAADRLHISAPPLTVQIRDLEAEIGTELLARKRKGRRLELTDAGRVFLDHARRLLAQADESIVSARRAATGSLGRLSIGYNPVAELGVLPRLVPALRTKWPAIEINWHSLKTPLQIEALARDELDLGFICPPVPEGVFDLQPLTQQPFIAVLPAKHRLATAGTIPWAALSDEPLILHSSALDPHSFRQIEQQFAEAGAVMRVVCELESTPSMIALVATGAGSCIAPEYVRNFCRDSVVCKPLAPPNILRTLAVAKKRGRDGLADLFYRFVVDNLTALPDIAPQPQRALAHS